MCADSLAAPIPLIMEPVRSRHLPDYIATLFMSTEYSDFTFCIENERLPVHKLILLSRGYFRALLNDAFEKNCGNEIHLEVPLTPFKAVLKYIYYGHFDLSESSISDVIVVLQLADMYNINDMVSFTVNYLKQNISVDDACFVLDSIRLLYLDELAERCLTLIDEHAHDVLLQDDFLKLSQVSIKHWVTPARALLKVGLK